MLSGQRTGAIQKKLGIWPLISSRGMQGQQQPTRHPRCFHRLRFAHASIPSVSGPPAMQQLVE